MNKYNLLPNEHLAALHLIDADISKYDFSRPSEVDDIGFCDIDVLLDRGWSKIEAEIAYRSLAEKGAIERGRIWDELVTICINGRRSLQFILNKSTGTNSLQKESHAHMK